jgi:hypothetical protein
MDMLCSKSVSLWKVSFLALLAKLALPGRSFLGDRDFAGICIWAQMVREVTRGLLQMFAAGQS